MSRVWVCVGCLIVKVPFPKSRMGGGMVLGVQVLYRRRTDELMDNNMVLKVARMDPSVAKAHHGGDIS